MNNDLHNMLKKILFFDVLVGVILTIAVYFISPVLSIFFLLGLFLAYVSLFLNALITNANLTNAGMVNKLFILLGFMVRVVLISVIGIIIFAHNKVNMIAYIAGYSVQFISLIFYGVTIKD